MKQGAMKKAKTHPLTDEQIAQLRALDGRPIDTDDIPEAPEENWTRAERGRFFRPLKQAINIRLDADLLDWFKQHAPAGRYQTEMNRVLRRYVDERTRYTRPRTYARSEA
jgi:uncharacterized protein (DUF4415 family)